jgi:hypothetical protein
MRLNYLHFILYSVARSGYRKILILVMISLSFRFRFYFKTDQYSNIAFRIFKTIYILIETSEFKLNSRCPHKNQLFNILFLIINFLLFNLTKVKSNYLWRRKKVILKCIFQFFFDLYKTKEDFCKIHVLKIN